VFGFVRLVADQRHCHHHTVDLGRNVVKREAWWFLNDWIERWWFLNEFQGGMVVFKGIEEVMFIDLRTAAAIECYLEEWMAGIQEWRGLEREAAHSYMHMCV